MLVIRVVLSLPARRAWLLLSGLFLSVLRRFVMTDRTAGCGAGNAMMSGDMSDDPTNHCPFQTPRRMRGSILADGNRNRAAKNAIRLM
jgi:hypothetical protein